MSKRRPRNLKKVEVYGDGSFEGSVPYIYCTTEFKPLRVTLDAQFGIEDLEWIARKMRKAQEGCQNDKG